MIERHGCPRAAILSARDFEIVLRIVARQKEGLTAGLLQGAIEKTASGHFNKAVKLKNAALLLAGMTR